MSCRKILLVDDVSENLQVLGSLLSGSGHDLSFATNGEQAIQTCRRWLPDLVLLDIMMPGMDGFEVCRRLKADPITAEIPIIFLSARSDESSVTGGFEIGAVDYLTKPFQHGELMARIRSQLELKMARDALVERNRNLLELNGALHRLLSVVSHDLKGPLRSMLSLLEVRKKNPEQLSDPAARLEFLTMLIASLGRSCELLDHLLAWSRSQSGNLEPRFESVDVASLIDEVVHILEGMALSKKVRFVCSVESGLVALADREMIRTVLYNLLSNALKFSYLDSEVRLDVCRQEGRACFRVRDFGVGISPENLSLLFRPDRPLTTPGTLKEPGSGFGLILCREFIMRNGGELFISGRPNEGTTAEFLLPLVPGSPGNGG